MDRAFLTICVIFILNESLQDPQKDHMQKSNRPTYDLLNLYADQKRLILSPETYERILFPVFMLFICNVIFIRYT